MGKGQRKKSVKEEEEEKMIEKSLRAFNNRRLAIKLGFCSLKFP
jgi:hypothetical protein